MPDLIPNIRAEFPGFTSISVHFSPNLPLEHCEVFGKWAEGSTKSGSMIENQAEFSNKPEPP